MNEYIHTYIYTYVQSEKSLTIQLLWLLSFYIDRNMKEREEINCFNTDYMPGSLFRCFTDIISFNIVFIPSL